MKITSFKIDKYRLICMFTLIIIGEAMLGVAIYNGEPAGTYVLWLLGALMSFFALKNTPAVNSITGKLTAWPLIAAAIAIWWWLPHKLSYPFMLTGLAVICYYAGIKMAAKQSVSLFIFTILLPSMSFLYVLLSFPLSRICAMFTVAILRLFGINCSNDLAVIYVGGNHIAVTSACSGIELLEAMLLVAWIVVYFSHKKMLTQVTHYLTLLPIIILCNTLRLVIVSILSIWIGAAAFNNVLHVVLGYAVIVASMLLLLGCSKLFGHLEDKK